MLYQQPWGVTDTNASYIDGNPSIGQLGSIPPAASIEQPQREIINVIQNNNYIPDTNDLAQMVKANRSQYINFATDTSAAANTILCTLGPALPLDRYAAGLPLRVLVANTNTGATVINVDGLGPQSIKRSDGADPHPGDIVAGMIANLCYTGSVFQLQNAVGAPATTSNTYTVKIPFAADTSTTANTVIAPFSPAITATSEGDFICVKIANTNTGAVQLTVNALAPTPINRDDGQPLQAGDILANEAILLENHATYWQFMGLVRSQVLTPPAPKLRGVIATASGFGAQYIGQSVSTALAYYNVSKNNMLNSTFDGVHLRVNAGEGGVWSVYGSVHTQTVPANVNFTEQNIFNSTTGEQIAAESGGYLQAGTGNSMSAQAVGVLNVGAVVYSAYYQQGYPLYTVPDTSMRFSAWLISL